MANESEDFAALRKLLALKRHEAPPPGYFDRLPREIHVRIAADRQPLTFRERHSESPSNWLASLLRLVESRPSFAGAVGTAICGLILTGIVYSHKREQPAATILPEFVQAPPLMQEVGNPANWAGGANLLVSTNPLMPRPPSSVIFDGSWLNAQPANFPPPSR